MSQRKLYDLAGADPALRFSPYCWIVRLALAHKGLDVKTIPWRFTDKDVIAFSGQGLVPVLVDGERVLHDSQAIVAYLEETYPDSKLLGDATTRALTAFVWQWTEEVLHEAIIPAVISDIHARLDPKDQSYFRKTREARLGKTIEEMAAGRKAALPGLAAALKPLSATLATQPFLAGAAPGYADYIVLGALLWATKTSSTKLLDAADPVAAWMTTVLTRLGLQDAR